MNWFSRRVSRTRTAPTRGKNAVEFEKRIGREHQLELELIQEVEDGDGTLPEMEVGWKWAFCYSLERQSLLSAGAKLAVPFESEGQFEAIPYAAWAKGLSEQFTLQASLRSHLPFETFEDGDVELAGIVHWVTTAWPRGVFPALEFTTTVPSSKATMTPSSSRSCRSFT